MKITIVRRFPSNSVFSLIALVVSLCIVKGTSGFRRSFQFTEYTTKENIFEVLEGDTVDLICHLHVTGDCLIEGDKVTYAMSGSFGPAIPDNVIFNRNESACILTIFDVTRVNEDFFVCTRPNLQYLVLKIIYSPSQKYPRCTSNYESHVSRFVSQ